MKYSQLDRDQPAQNKKKQKASHSFRSLSALFRTGKPLEKILFIAALAVFLISAFFLIRYSIASVKTKQLNADLQAVHNAGEAGQSAQETASGPAAPVIYAYTAAPVTAPPQAVRFVTPDVYSADRPAMATPSPTRAPYYYDMSGSILPGMNDLYAVNSDLVGWLRIPGLVDLPAVWRDNEYYLTHNFYRKAGQGGTLFVDELGPVAPRTQHILVHGHNMKDGTMFGPLVHYRSSVSYAKSHAFATFSTLYKEETYVLYAVVCASTDYSDPDYVMFMGHSTFPDEGSFYDFTQMLKARSLYYIPIDVQPCDALLTLSTCIGEDRLLCCFRRMRPDETKEQLNYRINQSMQK